MSKLLPFIPRQSQGDGKKEKGGKESEDELVSFFLPPFTNEHAQRHGFVCHVLYWLLIRSWSVLRVSRVEALTEESSRRGIRVKSGENPKTPTKGTVKILYYLITELGYCQITRDSTSRRCWPFDLILSTDSLGDASNKHFRPLDHQASISTVSFCAS